MRQRPARLLPVARRGGNADPEAAPGGAERGGAGEDAAAGGSRPHHRLRRQHAAAGVHERDPDQPDAQPRLHPDAGEQGLSASSGNYAPRTRLPSPLAGDGGFERSEKPGEGYLGRWTAAPHPVRISLRSILATLPTRVGASPWWMTVERQRHTASPAFGFRHHKELFRETA